jgi:hypothetical protein
MILHHLIPWRTFVVETAWSPEVAAIELGKIIEKPVLFARGEAPFVGKAVTATEFVFRRQISGRNSFLPRIHAVIEPSHHGGSHIRVDMRMHIAVIAFMAVWMTGATCGSLTVGIAAVHQGREAALPWVLFPLFGAAMIAIGFAPEARKAEHLLRALYARAPALPSPPDTGQAYR